MSKVLRTDNLSERPSKRALVAITLCATMATFGCTTDRNLGNGNPVVSPGVRTSPTGGSSAGSETEATPPPMMSSYSGTEALPTVQRRVKKLSASEAAAIMAQHQQQPRVKVLGPAYPGLAGRPYFSDGLAAQYSLPQVYGPATVNSSLTSAPTPGTISGAGEGFAAGATVADTGAFAAGVTDAAVVAGTNANGTLAVTNATAGATLASPSSAAVTPTGAAIGLPAGAFAATTLSPTAAAVVNPPASISGSPALATASATRLGAGRLQTVTPATPTTSTATTIAATTRAGVRANTASATTGVTATGTVNPVRVVNTNGRVTVTNVGSSAQRQQ
jgi:hypothetical protein